MEQRPRHVDPALPDEADANLLDPAVRDAVARIGGGVATRVGRHLAAAGLYLDDDPDLALQHAQSAKARAPRVAEVREVVGIAAYRAGDYTLARAELRAARRMSGTDDLVAILADAERALGNPQGALALLAEVPARRLAREERIEVAIVTAGARRDLGDVDAALAALRVPELTAEQADGATLRLWYAYADTLEAAGRGADAADYFARLVQADDQGVTDAEDRLRAVR